MANNPQIQVDVKMNDADFNRGIGKMSNQLKTFGRDIQQVSRSMLLLGGSITGAFAVAFKTASKDLPAVSNELKSLTNSFQALSDSVAIVALPTLKEFTNFINNLAIMIKNFAESHQELVNSVLKWGAITVAIATAGNALGIFVKTVSILIKPLQTLGVAIGITTTQFNIFALAILAVVDAALILTKIDWKTNLKNFATGGFLGFSAGGNAQLLKSQADNLKKTIDDLFNTTNSPIKRASDNTGRFIKGFQSGLKSLADNVEEFGKSVADSLQKAFSDTLFDAITGKIHGLRSVLKALGEDLLKAFLKQGTNAMFGGIFGTSDKPKSGLLGGIPSMLGFHKAVTPSKSGGADKIMEHFTKEVASSTGNLKSFQKTKDALMANFNQFGKTIQQVGKTHVDITKGLADSWGNLTQGIVSGFSSIISNLEAAVGKVLSLLKMASKGSSWMSWIGLAVAAVASIFSAGASLAAWAAGSAAALPSGAGITMAAPALLQHGGIVTRPTLALIGEAGAEAIVPLSKTKGNKSLGGNYNVNININEAILNNPSNMKQFCRYLREEFGRAV